MSVQLSIESFMDGWESNIHKKNTSLISARTELVAFAVTEVALGIVTNLYQTVESAVKVPLYSIGWVFPRGNTLKQAFHSVDRFFFHARNLSVIVIMAPLKIAVQCGRAISCPESVRTFNIPDSESKQSPSYFFAKIRNIQERHWNLYVELNEYALRHPILGRFLLLRCVVEDVVLPIYVDLLQAIQASAGACMHMVGWMYADRYNLKSGVSYTEDALLSTARVAKQILTSPLAVTFQLGAGLIHPERILLYGSSKTFSNRWWVS